MSDLLNKLLAALEKTGKPKTQGYDTQGTVTRVEGKTAWVHIPGGVDETPVKMTINANPGDTVQLRVSGGTAFLVGNQTAPPTDDSETNKKISATNKILNTVKSTASKAFKIAGNTNQYFWHTQGGTDTGAHITEIPQEEFLSDPSNGGGNLLARSNGIAVRDGLTELATFSADGLDVTTYDSNNDPVEIAHLGYGDGIDSGGGTSKAPYYTIGTRASGSTVGNYSVAEGRETTASEYASHAEGFLTTASGHASHAEGRTTTASGSESHAEGNGTTASDTGAHAEGVGTEATGYASHAEGNNTEASDKGAHAEGYMTTASGLYSHAEGYITSAKGNYSHASGNNTKASSANQTAIGKYNVEDTNNEYAFIIGNGTSNNARSNALTVDWYGNLNVAGEVYSNGTVPIKSWTYLGAVWGTSDTLIIPSSAKDVLVRAYAEDKGIYTGFFAYAALVSGKYPIGGYYLGTSDYGYCAININVSGTIKTVGLRQYTWGSTTYTSNVNLSVFYR